MSRKGENIFKRKDGRWEGRYIKARNGKKAVYGYVYGKSYSEVKKKKSEALNRIYLEKTQKKPENTSSPTLEYVARQWLEELKPIRKKSTIVKYIGQLKNYIIPTFGKMYINEINNENIILFSKNLLTGGKQGRQLLHKTVSDILSRMKSIRRFALLRGYEVNYVPNIIEIPLRQGQIRILTAIEESKLVRYLKTHFDFTALGILLSLFTGLRIGELCALKWS